MFFFNVFIRMHIQITYIFTIIILKQVVSHSHEVCGESSAFIGPENADTPL